MGIHRKARRLLRKPVVPVQHYKLHKSGNGEGDEPTIVRDIRYDCICSASLQKINYLNVKLPLSLFGIVSYRH